MRRHRADGADVFRESIVNTLRNLSFALKAQQDVTQGVLHVAPWQLYRSKYTLKSNPHCWADLACPKQLVFFFFFQKVGNVSLHMVRYFPFCYCVL